MPKLKIKTSFPYYHKGYERKDYVEGQEVDTEDEEFVTVATNEGWAEHVGAESKSDAPDLNSLTAAELKAQLEAKGVAFKSNASKAELLELLSQPTT